MIRKVQSSMEKYHMFPQNGNIVAGVSGGADSLCLLRVLVILRDRFGLKLTAVHVNHRIRQEAAEDAAFVERICREWDVPFVLVEEDVEALARQERISCEEAGRRVRYEAFESVLAQMDGAVQKGYDGSKSSGQKDRCCRGCIAVAHNSDDRAETLLFHMLRGTGLNGMGSIRPVRILKVGSRIIRPLLFCSREEIEQFLCSEGLTWCTDATNREDIYTRNKIRNHLLPYAQKQICERAREHLSKEAQLLAETSDFVQRMTREAMERCSTVENEEIVFDAVRFGKEDPFLQKQMVLQGLLMKGTGKDLTAAHVEQAMYLFAPECLSGKKMELKSCRVQVFRRFSQVVIGSLEPERKMTECAAVQNTEEAFVLEEGNLSIPGLGKVEVKILERYGKYEENAGEEAIFLQDIPEKKYTKWFDYDKIIESAVFRTRRMGDYLVISQSGAKKSLKRYMIEEKIPVNRRDKMQVLADGAHVMWVPGHRISAAYKVTEKTERILQVQLTGGREDG